MLCAFLAKRVTSLEFNLISQTASVQFDVSRLGQQGFSLHFVNWQLVIWSGPELRFVAIIMTVGRVKFVPGV